MIEGDRPPQTPIDFLLSHLVQFEQGAGIGDQHLRTFCKRLKVSSYASVRVTMLELILRAHLKRLDMSGFLSDVLVLGHAMALVQQAYTEGGLDGLHRIPAGAAPELRAEHANFMRSYAILGVFALAARGEVNADMLTTWRQEIIDADARQVFEPWLDLIEGLFVSGQIDARTFVRQSGIEWDCQCLAALRLAVAPDTEPASLAQCHGLWLNQFAHLPKRDWIAEDVATIVADGWARCADRPFQLCAPRKSVPAIREAIAASEQGWARVKRIVGAGVGSVRFEFGVHVRKALEDFPEGSG